ncbi:MAG: NAD(P)/FAD-dependent oxidoreductase [Victivallales bacterium]|nr:NAD(P)/FAD-dependent oxidoreductase [Victivallales bacterium]
MQKKFDVAVIGCGVVGAAIARELSRYKLGTAVIEKEADVSFGASKANSGIIHGGFHAPPETLKGQLVVPGNRMFDQLSEELDFPFERRGEFMVAYTEDELRILQTYYERGLQNKVPYLELIGRERVLEMEPNLNPDVMGALYAPTAGVICPYEYCFSLIDNAVENGVELFLESKVSWIGKNTEEQFEIETENGNKIISRYIINAAGLFADNIASYVGLHNFKIHPRKGEEYLLDRRVSRLVHRVIFPCPKQTSKGMLVIPTVDGPVMVGPTAVDVDDKHDLSTSREGLKEVFQYAQKMVPGIRTSDIITSFVGLRPVATGGDFILGKTEVEGFINAAGIQSPGLTASPAIAEYIRNVLIKEGVKLEHKPDFNPQRKSRFVRIRHFIDERDFNNYDNAVKKDSDYSKLVCRCENITEGEIVAAIKSGHTTLDGVKFATRAGTGRCQGGFCTSRVMEIIHRETGIPFELISKKGKGSEIAPYPIQKGNGK